MRALLVTCLVSASLSAQGTTWIVDGNLGPGAHFQLIQDAVDAAADGDTILVRSYSGLPGFTCSKGVTILGEGSILLRTLLTTPLVEVSNLLPGRTFTMRNIGVRFNAGAEGVRLRNNLGEVHFEDVQVHNQSWPHSGGAGVTITDCSAVTILEGWLEGAPALSVQRSEVAVTGTRMDGVDACSSSRCPSGVPAAPGVSVHMSVARLAFADVTGGGGASSLFGVQEAHPAIVSDAGVILVTGDATTSVIAGTRFGGPPIPAIQANGGGSVDVDPSVLLIGAQGGPPVGGTVLPTFRPIVALRGSGAAPGSVVTVDLVAPAGIPTALAVGVPGWLPLPPLGTLFIDFTTMTVLWVGVQPPGGVLTWNLTVPPSPALRGVAVALQGAAVYSPSARSELSNPAVVVLD